MLTLYLKYLATSTLLNILISHNKQSMQFNHASTCIESKDTSITSYQFFESIDIVMLSISVDVLLYTAF